MNTQTRPVVLLGPQRNKPDLRAAIDRAGIRGPLAAVTAGWEEREEEDSELSEHLGGRVRNLHVYARGEEVYEKDPELHEAMLERHASLARLQALYRMRLAHALESARTLLALDEEPWLVDGERESAIEEVRALDAHHLERVAQVHVEFRARMRVPERPVVVAARAALAREIADCEAVCVAGGHVTVLLNRMRMLGMAGLLGARPIFAWSAGAMVLSERIVLFHDSPPQGAGDAEVLENGLGLFRGVVPLPHARRRLRLDDPTRVGLFARRFGPDQCVPLDAGAYARSSDGGYGTAGWELGPGTSSLSAEGQVAGAGA